MSGTSPVVFQYSIWSALYPQFDGTVTETQAGFYWNLAGLYLDNTPCSVVPVTNSAGAPVRAPILGMITAQIAQLLSGSSLQPLNPLVGRVSGATEGSVSVQTELNTPVEAAWYTLTTYGFMAWQSLAPYRTALYIPGPRRYAGGYGFPALPFGGYPWLGC